MQQRTTNYFGYNLKKYRIEAKLSRCDLAEKLNFSETTIMGYEKPCKSNGVKLKTAISIANILDISLDDLFADHPGVNNCNDKNLVKKYIKKFESFPSFSGDVSLKNSYLKAESQIYETLDLFPCLEVETISNIKVMYNNTKYELEKLLEILSYNKE